MTEGMGGTEVGLAKQSELPWPTLIGGVLLPFPLESLSVITTVVPAAIVTRSQVYEKPVISSPVRAAIIGPSAVLLWKD